MMMMNVNRREISLNRQKGLDDRVLIYFHNKRQMIYSKGVCRAVFK